MGWLAKSPTPPSSFGPYWGYVELVRKSALTIRGKKNRMDAALFLHWHFKIA
jgi:hypothetical protein